MYRFIGIFLLAVAGIFINFGFLGSVGKVIVDFIIIANISYLLYDLWKMHNAKKQDTGIEINQEAETPENPETVRTSLSIFDIKPSALILLLKREKHYSDFLLNQFIIIRNFILPKNGYIFYRNKAGRLKLIYQRLEAQVEWQKNAEPKALLTLIDDKNDLFVENNIESAHNLFPFYDQQNYLPRALLSLITKFESGEKLYWIFDADVANHFNTEDLTVLETINVNTQTVLESALRDSGLEQMIKNVNDRFQLSLKLNEQNNFKACIDVFTEYISSNFEASKLTIATRSSENLEFAVIRKAVGIDDSFKDGYEFPLKEGLNGWVILKNKPYLLDDIDKGEFFIPRFTRQEKTNHQLHSFLSVPLQLNGVAVGMVTLEDKRINQYTIEDKERLIEYGKIFDTALGRMIKKNKN